MPVTQPSLASDLWEPEDSGDGIDNGPSSRSPQVDTRARPDRGFLYLHGGPEPPAEADRWLEKRLEIS